MDLPIPYHLQGYLLKMGEVRKGQHYIHKYPVKEMTQMQKDCI